MSHRLRPGSWAPPMLAPIDVVALVCVLSVQASFRAFDYVTGSDKSIILSPVEKAFPLWLWSGAFFLGAAVLLLGAILRIHLAVWAAHGWLLVWYVGLFVGFSMAALANPWLDGVRYASVVLTPITLHLLFVIRNGPRPIRLDRGEAEAVGEVIAGAPDGDSPAG